MISELFFISSLVLLRFVCYQLSCLNVLAECTLFFQCQLRVKDLLVCEKNISLMYYGTFMIFLVTIQSIASNLGSIIKKEDFHMTHFIFE